MTKEKQFSFLSKDGKTKIHAVKWMPESGEYRAVLQITHGMVEYIERYKPFAEFLNDQGVLVVGHDHLGHGASVASEEELGYFAEPDPSDTLVEDMHTLRTTIQTENPGVPYFMMGHSMGSYMLRKYLCIHPEGVAGANSWLSKNVDNVKAYYADPRCTFLFTVNGYKGLMEAVLFDNQMENIKKVPKNLPLFFVSGADDPVGDLGEGVKKVYGMYKDAGVSDITYRLYEDDRHEILNETDRDQVMADIAAWLNVHVEL